MSSPGQNQRVLVLGKSRENLLLQREFGQQKVSGRSIRGYRSVLLRKRESDLLVGCLKSI
jgi:hypothetical protein